MTNDQRQIVVCSRIFESIYVPTRSHPPWLPRLCASGAGPVSTKLGLSDSHKPGEYLNLWRLRLRLFLLSYWGTLSFLFLWNTNQNVSKFSKERSCLPITSAPSLDELSLRMQIHSRDARCFLTAVIMLPTTRIMTNHYPCRYHPALQKRDGRSTPGV
jgi:hypothetical protein